MLFTTAKTEADLSQILELQSVNLPKYLSKKEIESDGFLTCRHDLDLLARMNTPHPHIIASDQGKVVGYALVLRPELKGQVPIIDPLFEKIEELAWHDRPMKDYNYFVMGQVCVAKKYRGREVFSGLYEHMRAQYDNHYHISITEVSQHNHRSGRAHEKLGWQIAHSYVAPDGHPWNILVWDWS